MSRKVGWRLRRKNRLAAAKFSNIIKIDKTKPESKAISRKTSEAEAYIRHLGFLKK